jgi:hypothetical protein
MSKLYSARKEVLSLWRMACHRGPEVRPTLRDPHHSAHNCFVKCKHEVIIQLHTPLKLILELHIKGVNRPLRSKPLVIGSTSVMAMSRQLTLLTAGRDHFASAARASSRQVISLIFC